LAKHQPYLVRWVREFLLFARDHGGYTFEQTLDLFLAEVGGRPASSAPRTPSSWDGSHHLRPQCPQRRKETPRRDMGLDIRVLVDQPECQRRIRHL